jgi:hypothetical protein
MLKAASIITSVKNSLELVLYVLFKHVNFKSYRIWSDLIFIALLSVYWLTTSQSSK